MPSTETPKNILLYVRSYNDENVYVFLNFSGERVSFIAPANHLKLLTSTTIESNPLNKEGEIILTPWEGILLE